MNRQLEFRIYNRRFDKWITGVFRDISRVFPNEKDLIIQQYIGIKDSKQIKIFEGDILTFCGYNSGKFQVIWMLQEAKFGFQSLNDDNYILGVNNKSGEHATIIGNIFNYEC